MLYSYTHMATVGVKGLSHSPMSEESQVWESHVSLQEGTTVDRTE